MPAFLEAVSPAEAHAILSRFQGVTRVERVPLMSAAGRVAAAGLFSPEALPSFDRSLMDGYAVRARDTFGASEGAPSYLRLAGRIPMGALAGVAVEEGTCLEISTGGALPPGADAVVMVEHCREVGEAQVEISRAAAPLENVLKAGGDVASGELLVERGHRLTGRDVLALAALGIDEVEVFARPVVGVLSTGDEVVPVGAKPSAGQVRDCNAVALAAEIREAGAEALFGGICPDDPPRIEEEVRSLLGLCDAVFLSGGSSQGARDATAAVFSRVGEVLAHGIAVAPGKPTLIAEAAGKPLIGLPGHPVSSFVIARVFMRPLLRRLCGEPSSEDPFPKRVRARLGRNVASKPGREDWIRVRLEEGSARPLLKGSGAVSTLLHAHGLVRIPLESEGLRAGEEVEVLLF